MRIKSFAKINLGLEVIKKREDNYHQIRTLFQTIDLYDVLDIRSIENNEIALSGSDESIPWDKRNLIFKAASLLKEQCQITAGVEIHVIKNIPPGKGLGGGSSNAAIVLHVLNKIWRLRLNKEELMELAKKLGADVPFFLEGGLCLGLERGDRIIPLPDLEPLPCVLVLPPFPILTSDIYGDLEPFLTSMDKDSKINKFLESAELGFLENRLEATIFRLYPQLKAIKSLFQSQGVELSLVSGTGSAVFGLFLERERAEKGLEALREISPALLVETLSRERYWKGLRAGV